MGTLLAALPSLAPSVTTRPSGHRHSCCPPERHVASRTVRFVHRCKLAEGVQRVWRWHGCAHSDLVERVSKAEAPPNPYARGSRRAYPCRRHTRLASPHVNNVLEKHTSPYFSTDRRVFERADATSYLDRLYRQGIRRDGYDMILRNDDPTRVLIERLGSDQPAAGPACAVFEGKQRVRLYAAGGAQRRYASCFREHQVERSGATDPGA